MGLFNKKTYYIPENALNIGVFSIRDFPYDCKNLSLYLETNDGFITRDKYTAENMKNVTAFVFSLGSAVCECTNRIELKNITAFSISPSHKDAKFTDMLTNMRGDKFNKITEIEFKDGSKKWHFEVVDTYTAQYNSLLFKDIINLDESCIYALDDIYHFPRG